MVTQWGMSERLGPRTFGRRHSMIFLGRDISEERDYSERTAEEIDDEVRRLIDEAHVRCRALLNEHRDKLDALAARLVDVETVEGDDLLTILGPWEGRPLPGELDLGHGTGTTPPAGGLPAGEAEPEEAPQGRPGIAWGNTNAAQPSE